MSGWIPTARRLGLWLAGLALCTACGTLRQEFRGPGQLYAVTLPRADGTRLRFRQFRHQVLMVDFFTTWGPTAVMTIPGYAKLYHKYREQGLAVVGVSLDELGAKVVEPFVQGLEVPYPVVVGDEKVLKGESFFGTIGATPMLMIFDQDGSLVKIFVGHVPLSEVEKVILRVLR